MKTNVSATSQNMERTEIIAAWGHENILATNINTFEITKDTHLTKKGNCIIGVAANKNFSDLSDEFKKLMQRNGTKIIITIEVDGERVLVDAEGNPELTFKDSKSMVVRKSNYTCSRTLAIKSNKAANDFPRNFVEKLKNPHKQIFLKLYVKHNLEPHCHDSN